MTLVSYLSFYHRDICNGEIDLWLKIYLLDFVLIFLSTTRSQLLALTYNSSKFNEEDIYSSVNITLAFYILYERDFYIAVHSTVWGF